MNKLFLIIGMVDFSAFAFVPPLEPRRNPGPSLQNREWHLIPSNVYVDIKGNGKKIADVHESQVYEANDLSIEVPPAPKRSLSKNSRKKRSNHRQQPPRFGNLPDVQWRAISMDHLRLHPQFDALPVYVDKLDCLEDVRNFRQDSWQWDALHAGRCTTSQAAAALGFLEPQAATMLHIPKSWQRGGISAYQRLRGRALNTLDDIRSALLQDESNDASPNDTCNVWSRPPSSHYPFSAKYNARIAPQTMKQRRARHDSSNQSIMSVKMMWGSAQEPTSLLTALNYFYQFDPGVRLVEVGMCGAGLEENKTFLLGASPDALIRYSNGTMEVLEVKNHCPFASTYRSGSGGKSATDKNFVIKFFTISEPYLQPLYVPQLMMEMLCTGCQSAIMVRQTATNGAWIIRLHRNDQWISEMMYWLQEFQTRFVQMGIPPPANFFWHDESPTLQQGEEQCLGNSATIRYSAFVQHTYELAGSVQVLAHVKQKDIQRALGVTSETISLFLD